MGKSKNKKQSQNQRNNGSSNKVSWNAVNFQTNSRVRSNSASYSVWGDSDEHFPTLGAVAAPLPRVNVWEERKSKQEAVKALEPRNEYDEDAMLQQALALSIIEAAEEERRRKEEKEFLLQAGDFEYLPEELEYFDASEEFNATTESKFETPSAIQQNIDNPKEKIPQNNPISNCNQNVKTYTCNGAKPKINKIIERFGGWGLKDEIETNSSEKLCDFVDEIVNEKPLKANKNDKVTAPKYQSDQKSVKENKKDKSIWSISDKKEVKKPATISDPWEEDEVLYDGKGTFVDNDSNHIQKDIASNLPKYTSPNKVLDSWLNSEDDNSWGNGGVLKDKKLTVTEIDVQNDKVDFINDLPKCGQFKDRLTPVSTDIDFKSENTSNKVGDTFDFSSESNEWDKNSWSDYKHENESCKSNSSACSLDINEHKVMGNRVTKEFSQPVELHVPHFPSKDTLEENPSTTSPYFTLFPDKNVQTKTDHDSEIKSMKFCEDIRNEVNSISNDDDDAPPILPPQPAPTISNMNEENNAFTNGTLENDSKEPPILPPQPAPQNQPIFPGMSPFLYNPAAMFPGFNPILPCAVDPVAMRQMLMLSNPFFASQLLAMEQYYRSMGMPVDLFSLSTSMPVASAPGIITPSVEQNAFASTVSSANTLNSQYQNHFGNGSFVPMSQSNSNNSDQNSFEICTQSPSTITTTVPSSKNTPSVVQNDDFDSWYKSYLSNDSSAAIPPPKPPSCTDANDNVLSVPEPLSSNRSASSFNQNSVPVNTYPSSVSNIDKDLKPFSAVEANLTKIEVNGWSDNEDEPSKTFKAKTTCGWDDDDGWGNDSVPTKSFKSHSVSQDKKTVYRQPSRQPQFSRYQRNKT